MQKIGRLYTGSSKKCSVPHRLSGFRADLHNEEGCIAASNRGLLLRKGQLRCCQPELKGAHAASRQVRILSHAPLARAHVVTSARLHS
eukprot:5156-Heterococcus_DN1.PRE.1